MRTGGPTLLVRVIMETCACAGLAAGMFACSWMTGCTRYKEASAPAASKPIPGEGRTGAPAAERPPRPLLTALQAGEVYVYDDKNASASKIAESEARASGMLVVDLGDLWAPFIFQDGGPGDGAGGTTTGKGTGAPTAGDTPKPNRYRQTFVDLANDRANADGRKLGRGEHNYLEPFGIPPTFSVLRARVEEDAKPERLACDAKVDREALTAFTGNVAYVDRERARRDHAEAARDAAWLNDEIARREAAATTTAAGMGGRGADAEVPPASWKAGDRAAALKALREDPNPKLRARVDRAIRGQEQTRAVQAVQARLVCEGLLSARSRYTPAMFDLPTHEALADWERKNDIFGWASVTAAGETLTALSRPALELDLETFRRILAERVADAAGIVEDGSAAKGRRQATYVDRGGEEIGGNAASATEADKPRPVPNLIEDHVQGLLDRLHVRTTDDLVDFLRQHGADGLGRLKVAFHPPPLPPYYGPQMDLSVEIDRGDVWYDFPFDARGRAVQQPRDHFPELTMFVNWRGQKIALVRWRTTIGSWRSELHANGKVYYKYKNSDVGPRFWKSVVAGPVWVPPDATPAKDLLTRKVLDRDKGAEVVVNTDVMGPGFQSAYGLVMAIHIDQRGFDNQIRSHGSVDYTSIARRFSHGCHRLVNNRAVRLFDFVLRRQPFRRVGSVPLHLERKLVVDDTDYSFELTTRGYYYELRRPIPVTVLEGRVRGSVKTPVVAYIPKVGIDYSDVEDLGSADSATSVHPPADNSASRRAVPSPASSAADNP